MKTNLFLAFAAIAALGLSSCETNEAPTIMVHSPTSGTYTSGDTVHIHVDFSDDKMLNEVAVTIVRELGDTVFFHAEANADSVASTSLHGDLLLLTSDHTDFNITAIATDQEGESTTNESSIHCHP